MEKFKPLATAPDNLPRKPATGSAQRVLTDRMSLSEAVEAAGAIIDRFPNGGRGAGDAYIGALASTLASYPRVVALRCADYPNKPGKRLVGICATAKFLPTPADLIAWCDDAAAPLHSAARRESNVAAQLAARDQDRADRPTYEELRAKYGAAWVDAPERKPSWELAPDELAKICGDDVWAKIPDARR